MTGTPRAQTTLDFAAGVSLFLLVLVSTVAMFPSLFGPFSNTGDQYAVTANRAADRLATDLLVGSTRSERLDADCTAAFFDADGAAPSACRYTADGKHRHRALGVLPRRRVNVSIQNRGGVYSLDGQRLAVGPVPESTSAPVIARRIVLLEQDTLRLVVRVW